ncbi:MAG: hypothetical protein HZB70_03150 [Candidatus Berkelbacteria bacterium]|nr:MAG: hypothetical protein HZB70_03150 [Candidatus Berkelbacteria bacterium]QQG51702.1 MAG: hypothetical protein HY845_04040 [Candidatus Berkelbacteria bacterium]
MKNKRSNRKRQRRVDKLYVGEDRQEELIDIILQCFVREQGGDKKSSEPNSS